MHFKWFIAFILVCTFSTKVFAAFDDWFLDHTLRIDYYRTGNKQQEVIATDALYASKTWAGPRKNLIDTSGMGNACCKVYDAATHQLIFSKGYGSLYYEWRATPGADTGFRTISESLLMPFPIKPVRVEWFSRDLHGHWARVGHMLFTPGKDPVDSAALSTYPVYEALLSGPWSQKVDIVVLPEGYTAGEMDRFKADVDTFARQLLQFEPWASARNRFNIRAIMAPSAESGTDVPTRGIWKNTLLNASESTFGLERYLMTFDNRGVRNLASQVPYDQVYILANSRNYGGGAIYNDYSLSVTGNSGSSKIFCHEFGHAFAGLADEYVDEASAFGQIYLQSGEPWEPNIATWQGIAGKWGGLLPPGPYSAATIPGVYEGAGYVAKELFRSEPDCLMRSLQGTHYCVACTRAIWQAVRYYCDEP